MKQNTHRCTTIILAIVSMALVVPYGHAFGENALVAATLGSDELIQINPTSGQGDPIGPLGFGSIAGLAFDSNSDTLYAVDDVSDLLLTVDLETGMGTSIGSLGIDIDGLAYDSNSDTLFGSTFDGQLVTINTTTGNASIVGPVGYTGLTGLAFDPYTDTLYAVDGFYTLNLLTIDPTTGQGTSVGPLGAFVVSGLAFHEQSRTLYGIGVMDSTEGQLMLIDSSTGSASLVGTHGFGNALGLAYSSLEVIPEPASSTYGIIGLLLFARRRGRGR